MPCLRRSCSILIARALLDKPEVLKIAAEDNAEFVGGFLAEVVPFVVGLGFEAFLFFGFGMELMGVRVPNVFEGEAIGFVEKPPKAAFAEGANGFEFD
jgi:hypothetical protein